MSEYFSLINNYMIRLYIPILFTLLLLSIISTGQPNSDNYIRCDLTTNLRFDINSTSLVENPQTLSNAIMLTVASKRNDATIYASIPGGITTSTSTPMPAGNIILKYNHTTCPSKQQKNVITSELPLNTGSTLLFRQGKKSNLTAYWYYDVKIPALGYSYMPGNYNFTIMFTMTQP